MDPLISKEVNHKDLSLSSLCLVCCSKVDLNVTQFVENYNDNQRTQLIEKNLGIIFLLRNLLIVPDHQLKNNLKECGNPGDWGINLCVECSLLIRQARVLHGLILKIGRKLRDLQKVIVDKTKKSSGPSIKNKQTGKNVGNSQKKCEIWRRTREFVKNYNYNDQFINPFLEGDKLAKLSIGREKSQEQPQQVEVNQTSLKREEVPFPQIEVELDGGVHEVPFNYLEDENDDMDWQEEGEEEAPLEYDDADGDEVVIGETKVLRSSGRGQKVTKVTSSPQKPPRRVQRPNIIVDGKYKCRYCEEDVWFEKRKACLYHESKHLSGKPIGEVRTRTYQRRTLVDGKWKCRHCDHLFDTVKGLHAHEKGKHVEIKGQFVCDLCGKRFDCKKDLQSHNYKRHGLLASGAPVQKKKEKKREPLVCNICGGTLWSGRGLQNHLQVVHGGLFKFECEICGRKIPTSTALKKHMLSRHKGDEVTKRMVREEGVRLWGCEVRGCLRKFMLRGSLDAHKRTVHGEGMEEGNGGKKRYNCERCGRGFWERHKLRRHELIHEKK